MTDEAEGAGRRLRLPVHLRWGDLDAYNHVNNATMLQLLEEARIQALWHSEAETDGYPTAVLGTGLDDDALSLIAHQEIEYLVPVPYRRAPLEVELWFGGVGGSHVEICYEVYSPLGVEPRVLYARASATLVRVDAKSGRPLRLTNAMRSAWRPYLGERVFPRRR